jgi:hypothetical protein
MYTLSSGKISAVWYSGTLNSKNKRLFSIRHCTIIGIIQYKQLNKLQNVAVIYINIKIHIDLNHFFFINIHYSEGGRISASEIGRYAQYYFSYFLVVSLLSVEETGVLWSQIVTG